MMPQPKSLKWASDIIIHHDLTIPIHKWVKWNKYRQCSYCGGVHPEDFYNYLTNLHSYIPGVIEIEDGYQYKIYFDDHHKFYTQHLFEVTDQTTLQEFLNTLEEKARIRLKLKNG